MQNIVLVDDHVLLRQGLANLVESFGDYKVLFQADNGDQFIEQLSADRLPHIVLMDINMPVKDGYETSVWLKKNYPAIKILALSMYDNENSVIRMFKAGAKGYILKDCDPSELKNALHALVTKGFYYSEMITGKLIHNINTFDDTENEVAKINKFSEREITFLKLACTEYTYKEIADKMLVSTRSVDGYRDGLFEKLNVKSRVGLVLFAIRNGIITL
ncbi:response regulator transcription factor [Ginsengibacter hankyongi]|uniref:Response regulator transcription factor n=1 Tax=Ginsengibacter hankyongi TaxID=2607284 RepID=A0A5J5IBK2_9BACT|nr:response regulator transcription factor [Ginsengibacter hankyongi]KAA9034545.1 response regulator transcription factor [Ginsengibacter hankyongi]